MIPQEVVEMAEAIAVSITGKSSDYDDYIDEARALWDAGYTITKRVAAVA